MKTIRILLAVILICASSHGQRISDLPAIPDIADSDLLLIYVPGVGGYKVTLLNFATNLSPLLTVAATVTNAVASGSNLAVTNATSFGVFYGVAGLTNMQFFNVKQGTNMVLYTDGSNIVINSTGVGGSASVSEPLSSIQFNSNGVMRGSSGLQYTNGYLLLASNLTVGGSITNLNTNAVVVLLAKNIQRRTISALMGYGAVDFQYPNPAAGGGVGVTKSAQGNFSFIGGGGGNLITNTGANSFLGAGIDSIIQTTASFIGAGNDLQIINPNGVGSRDYNAIVGGTGNVLDQTLYSVIAGGALNHIGDGFQSFIVEGGFVGGGANNEVDANYGSILGGLANTANAVGAQIVGNGIVNGVTNGVMLGYGPSNVLTIAPSGTTNIGLFVVGNLTVTNLISALSLSVVNFYADTMTLTNALGSNAVRLGLHYLTNVVAVSPADGDVLSWNDGMKKWTNVVQTGGAGTPGGNSGTIQFNQGGVFAGTNDFLFDRTNAFLTLLDTFGDFTGRLRLNGVGMIQLGDEIGLQIGVNGASNWIVHGGNNINNGSLQPAISNRFSVGSPTASVSNIFVNVVRALGGGTNTFGPSTFTEHISAPTNIASFVINTNDFALDTYYTNSAQRTWVSANISMTNNLATEKAWVGLYLDQNGDGTWERTGINCRLQGVVALSGSEPLAAFLQPSARFIFTNLGTVANATVEVNSSQWVRH